MARYDILSTRLQNTIYSNSSGDIKGNTLQTQLIAFINTLGKGSNFMGILTNSNKPTSLPDGKQFYIGYNNSATALSVNLTAVGLGTISITRNKIYVVYCDDNGWAAVDIASGISTSIPTNINQLDGYEALQEKEAYIEDGENVKIDKLKSNTAYYLKDCDKLDVLDYGYDIADPQSAANLPETHLFVYANSDFDVTVPAGSLLRNGDSLSLANGEIYLITVKCNFWKVELYKPI
jgi:hypothetical protein